MPCPPTGRVLRLAGLLHDLGKATTLADGHFIGHDREGAPDGGGRPAAAAAAPREMPPAIVRLVRQHMFAYTSDWTDAAVRRFVRRVGADLLDDLFALRAADNAASGASEPATGGTTSCVSACAAVLATDALEQGQLAIDGNDLIAELGAAPGPQIGELLRRLLEAVLDDPSLNTRERLLDLAARVAVGAWCLRATPGRRGRTL